MNMALKFKLILMCLTLVVMLGATFFSDFLPMPHGTYADQRFILCIALVLLIALTISSNKFIASRVAVLLPFLLCLLLGGLVSSLKPFNWLEPLLYCFFFLAICFLGYFFHAYKFQDEASRYFIVLTVVVCFFYAALTVMLYVFSLESQLSNFSNVMPAGFVNIRYWSHTATLLIPLFPLALMEFKGERFRLWRLLVMFTAAVWWWLAIHMMSRGSFFSLIIAIIIVFLLFRGRVFLWLKHMIFFFLLGGGMWFLLSYVVPEWILNVETTLLRDVNTTTSGRLPLWEEAWAMSLQNFPFGMGAQSWLTHELLTDSYKEFHKFGHPHNMFLMWAAEYGWLSVFSFLGLVLWVVLRLKQKANYVSESSGKAADMLIAFSVAAIAGFVHGGVSAVFIVPASMMLALGVLSIFWALILPNDHSEEGAKASSNRQLIKVLIMCLFSLIAVWWLLQVWQYHQAMAEDLASEEGARAQDMMPRFWVYGNYPRPDTLNAQ